MHFSITTTNTPAKAPEAKIKVNALSGTLRKLQKLGQQHEVACERKSGEFCYCLPNLT